MSNYVHWNYPMSNSGWNYPKRVFNNRSIDLDTEARKRRRKRNQYRHKLIVKNADLDQVVAKMSLITILGEEKTRSYEYGGLARQKEAATRKIARLRDILATLSPPISTRGEKGNTS